jgi:hypothetical protein
MGLDLDLLPFDAFDNISFSHTVLCCDRKRDLFEKILKLVTKRVPNDFTSYLSMEDGMDHHYGRTVRTPYGDALCYTTVGALLKFKDHVCVKDNVKNKAIWAYLNALPKKTKVALYWH